MVPGFLGLFMIQLLVLVFRLAGKIYTELTEYIDIHLGKDDAGMYFGSFQVVELIHGFLRIRISGSGNGKRDQNLIRVKSGIAVAQVIGLQFLDRSDGGG